MMGGWARGRLEVRLGEDRLRDGDQGRRPCMREQSCLQTTESRRHAAGGPGPASRPLIRTRGRESRPLNVEGI